MRSISLCPMLAGIEMAREDLTPFKHTGCGGVIARERGWRGTLYRCTQCGAVSRNIDDLLLTEAFTLANMEANQKKEEN